MAFEKERIIFLTEDSKPQRGGIAEYLHQLCEYLGGLGETVGMGSTVRGSSKFPTQNYKITELNERPDRQLGTRFGDRLPLFRKVNTYAYYKSLEKMAKEDISAFAQSISLAVIGYWNIESHFWCEVCRRRGIPYAVICYGLELVQKLSGPAERWRRGDLSMARSVVAVSAGTAQLVERVAGRKAAVIHPGIDPAVYQEPSKEMVAKKRADLSIPPGAKVLLSVGRLIPRKGADAALRALSGLNGEPAHYVVAGDGPERGNLERLAERLGLADRVHFTGPFEEAEKWILFALADVFLMPTRTMKGNDWEGFGIVFLEAALAGKPSIGGDNGGVPDAIVHGQTGFLVPEDDPEALSQAIRRLLSDSGARTTMGQKAQERALKEFNWAEQVKKFRQVVGI